MFGDAFVDAFVDTCVLLYALAPGRLGCIPQTGRQRQRVAAGESAAATSRQLQPATARSPAIGGRPPAAVDKDVVVSR